MNFQPGIYTNERVYTYVNNVEVADLQKNTLCSLSKTLEAQDICKETMRHQVHKGDKYGMCN